MVCKFDTFKLAVQDSSNNLKLCFNLRYNSQMTDVRVKMIYPQIAIQILNDKFLKIQDAPNCKLPNLSLTFQG